MDWESEIKIYYYYYYNLLVQGTEDTAYRGITILPIIYKIIEIIIRYIISTISITDPIHNQIQWEFTN